MKNLLLIFLTLVLFTTAQAASFPVIASLPGQAVKEPGLQANSIMVPIGNSGNTISLMALSEINVADFERLRGKKLSFFNKIGFKAGQRKLRNKINADGTIKDHLPQSAAKKMAENNKGFHLGGFALGFLLQFYGIIIAYLIKDDKKKARVKWAWIGLGTLVVAIFVGTILFALSAFE